VIADSNAGSGRNRGPTLLETHNEKSAAITNEVRRTASFDWINRFMNYDGNLTISFMAIYKVARGTDAQKVKINVS
jgi:hypothetical protein